MIRWQEFAQRRPDLAEIGQKRIFQFGPGLAFLATVRKDGGPRMHPICPVLAQGGLYFFCRPASPKSADLRRDGRYALHCFPPPPEGQDEEFYCTGTASVIEAAGIRDAAIEAALHEIHGDDLSVEFLIERVLHTTWNNWGQPDTSPNHEVWRA